MIRIYFLEPSLFAAKEIITYLKQSDLTIENIAILADQRWKTEILDADPIDLEQRTDVSHAQSRAVLTGVGVGGLVGLGVSLIPAVGIAIASAGIIGSMMGGSLGLVIGTLIGTNEQNPIVQEYDEKIRAGSVLIVLDLPEDQEEPAVQAILSQHPDIHLQQRNLLGVKTPDNVS